MVRKPGPALWGRALCLFAQLSRSRFGGRIDSRAATATPSEVTDTLSDASYEGNGCDVRTPGRYVELGPGAAFFFPKGT
jgi:hypothetical protein